MDFLTALRERTEATGSKRGKRLLARIEDMNPRRKRRVVARLEEHARVHLQDEGVTVGDDWGQVGEKDWSKFFEQLLEFLTKLLPILLSLFGA